LQLPDIVRQQSGFSVRELRRQTYVPVWTAMREYTASRELDAVDEFWVVEHEPVFTLGQAADPSHIIDAGDIEVVRTDRGGQVTYHGPGQTLVYVLLDLKRLGVGVRDYVCRLEQAVIDTLASGCIEAHRRPGAPGVYVGDSKIAALGVRVTRGCTYHGLALNVDMDLEPFNRINPCGYAGLAVTQIHDLDLNWTFEQTADKLLKSLSANLTP